MDEVIAEIRAERLRQIYEEGFGPQHDDCCWSGELAHAAAAYAGFAGAADWAREEVPEGCPPPQWPWAERFWKPKTRRRDLIRAAALIVAEIERLERAEA